MERSNRSSGTEDGLPYFVMEYAEGRRISEYADARRLSIQERVILFRQVCDAVHYAHQGNIVHRDLKPGNILVTAEGQVKLLDFGIARLEQDTKAMALTRTGMLLMTPDFGQPLRPPQRGQQKPPGQRSRTRYSRQGASVEKRASNSSKSRGKSSIGGHTTDCATGVK